MEKLENKKNRTIAKLIKSMAQLDYHLYCYGECLQKKHKYKTVDDEDIYWPIRVYLINKHHWLPRDVMSMSSKELRIALTDELKDFTISTEESLAWDNL